jgi:hypothetical protein
MSRLQELLEGLCRHAGITAMHEVVESQEVDIDGVCMHLESDLDEVWLSITAVVDMPPVDVVDRAALMRAALTHSCENRADPYAMRFSLLPDQSAYAATLLLPLREFSDGIDLLEALADGAASAQEEFAELWIDAAGETRRERARPTAGFVAVFA